MFKENFSNILDSAKLKEIIKVRSSQAQTSPEMPKPAKRRGRPPKFPRPDFPPMESSSFAKISGTGGGRVNLPPAKQHQSSLDPSLSEPDTRKKDNLAPQTFVKIGDGSPYESQESGNYEMLLELVDDDNRCKLCSLVLTSTDDLIPHFAVEHQVSPF
jgi:hypothetical protein